MGHSCLAGSTQPDRCHPSTYADTEELSACKDCEAGKFASESEATACEDCPGWPEGGYCPTGSANPLSCEIIAKLDHSTVSVIKAKNATSCVCRDDYYDSRDDGSPVDCEPCPSGTRCDMPGNTLRTLPVLPGYYRHYRAHGASIDIIRCPDASFGCSNEPVCLNTTSGCVGSLVSDPSSAAGPRYRRLTESQGEQGNSSALCRTGLAGVLCRLCVQREGMRVYYAPATDSAVAQCKPCKGLLPIAIGAGVAIVSAVVVLAVVMRRGYRRLSDRRKQYLRHGVETIKPFNKLKIVLGFYLMCARPPFLHATRAERYADAIAVPTLSNLA